MKRKDTSATSSSDKKTKTIATDEMNQLAKRLVTNAARQGIKRYVVGGIISRDDKMLVMQRSLDDFMGGMFELPSGKVDGDEDLLTALEREILEETALKVSKVSQYLGHFDYRSGSGVPTRQFNFAVEASGEVKLSKEHQDFAWVKPQIFSLSAETVNVVKTYMASM